MMLDATIGLGRLAGSLMVITHGVSSVLVDVVVCSGSRWGSRVEERSRGLAADDVDLAGFGLLGDGDGEAGHVVGGPRCARVEVSASGEVRSASTLSSFFLTVSSIEAGSIPGEVEMDQE
jgi:hypothetical protein